MLEKKKRERESYKWSSQLTYETKKARLMSMQRKKTGKYCANDRDQRRVIKTNDRSSSVSSFLLSDSLHHYSSLTFTDIGSSFSLYFSFISYFSFLP
jgi:hypothetical protein